MPYRKPHDADIFVHLLTVAHQVFLNIVLDDAVEEKEGGEKVRIGQVVRSSLHTLAIGATLGRSHTRTTTNVVELQVIRGNSVVMLEALERMGGGGGGHDDRR